MKLVFWLLLPHFIATMASAALPIECGIYTFYGYLREAPDGFLYISTDTGLSSRFEIRVIGIPRSTIASAFVGLQFYNPQTITTTISNHSVIFLKWQSGDAFALNGATAGVAKSGSSYRWPQLQSSKACDHELDYYNVKPSSS